MDIKLQKVLNGQPSNNRLMPNIFYYSIFFTAFGSFLSGLFCILQYYFSDDIDVIGIVFAVITIGCIIGLTSIKRPSKKVMLWKYIEACAGGAGLMSPIIMLSGFYLVAADKKCFVYICIFMEVTQLVLYIIDLIKLFSLHEKTWLKDDKYAITKLYTNLRHLNKAIFTKIKLYCRLPHIWISFGILILSMLMLYVSFITKDANPYVSSISANVFTGLITGVVICLISAVKTIQIYKTESVIQWLIIIHEQFVEYRKNYNKMLNFKKHKDLSDPTKLYDFMYDTLCIGNDINITISQDRFNKSIPFNTYKYCKKHFDYDVIEKRKVFDELRESIIEIDPKEITSKQIRTMFAVVDKELFLLNGEIIHKRDDLQAKLKVLNISIL